MAGSEPSEKKEEFTDHLFDTLREGLLVLDNEFCVEKANSSFYSLFEVEPGETRGKKLFELGNGQWDIPELRRLLEEVLPEKKMIKDYQVEHTFKAIGHRIMLLSARQIDHAQLILLAIEDVTDRKEAMQEVKEAKDHLEERVEERTSQVRQLASRLTESEENERRRISDILHDDLQQKLFAIRMNLNFIHRQIDSAEPNEQMQKKISDVIKKTDQAIEKTRQLSSDLNPSVLKSGWLTEMLEWLAMRFDQMHNLKTDLQADANFMIHDKEVRVVLLKIVRELLFNIVKHADTDHAIIKVNESADGQMVIHVIDEGSGFDVNKIDSKEHFGLFSIRDRLDLIGGSLQIDSARDRGTRMRIEMPVGDNITSEKAD